MRAPETFDVENDPAPPNHPIAPALNGQRELREAEDRMRSVVDHVLDGIITIDERGTGSSRSTRRPSSSSATRATRSSGRT